MGIWVILEVFPECFPSHMNPSVTSSVTFHIRGSCPKNGKTGRIHASEIMASEMCEWFVLLYKICTVFTIEKCEFCLKTFFLTIPGQRHSCYPRDQCYIFCKTFHGRTMSRQTLVHFMPSLMEQACNPMRMKWACLGYRPAQST